MLKAILCTDDKGNIGNDGKLIFKIKEDLKYFKQKTKGKDLLMGRKTFEDILQMNKGNPLVGRKHYVLTSKDNFGEFENVEYIRNYEELINGYIGDTDKHLFLIGGGSLYNLLLEEIEELLLTLVFPENKEYQESDKLVKIDLEKISKLFELRNETGIILTDGNSNQFEFLKGRKVLI